MTGNIRFDYHSLLDGWSIFLPGIHYQEEQSYKLAKDLAPQEFNFWGNTPYGICLLFIIRTLILKYSTC